MTGPTHADLLRALTRDHSADCECEGCAALAEFDQHKATQNG